MSNGFASFYSIIAAVAIATNVEADAPNLTCTMNVSLAFQGDENHAVIWVSDGTHFSELAAVADAAAKTGMTKITLSVEPKGGGPMPMHVTGDQHVGIQLSAEHAEIFVSKGVPYAFIQTLSNNLQQLPNIADVMLRSVTTRHDPTEVSPGTDPFAADAPRRSQPAPAAPKSQRTNDPFGN